MSRPGVHFSQARGPDGVAVYAIGDVHGRLDLLERMHDEIAADIDRRRPADWRIVHLGDYVDRGPDSRGVLDRLADATQADSRIVALAGNHDVGFVDFLIEPQDGLFVRYGGVQTVRSYGVELEIGSPAALAQSHAALLAAVPQRHLTFLIGLRRSISFGDFFYCHAGIRPRVALEAQDATDLVWIREEFLRYTKLHEKVVVHGHTPMGEPEILANRVNLDTGAFATGRLTGLVVHGMEKQILSVQGPLRQSG